MRLSHSQRGSLHLVAILAVVVIAVAGVIGYKVFTNEKDSATDVTSSQTDEDSIESIETTSDIDEASASLEEFDSELDPNQLDEDLNSLL